MAVFERAAVEAALTENGSIAAAARALGVERRRLSEFVNADPDLLALRWEPTKAATDARVDGDEAQVTTGTNIAPAEHGAQLEALGLDPSEWVLVALKRWQTYHGDDRFTTTYRRRVALEVVSPAVHVPVVRRERIERAPAAGPELIVVEGDHQAPYHDPALDVLATEFVRDLQPVEHVFLGDLVDLPTVSRHPDHPAARATAQECLDAGYAILRARAEAAPNARRRFLKGNHDWRLESELLARSERTYEVRPVGEVERAMSIGRLLHFDALGVEFVEDPRGWEHAEIELVPGRDGLVVRHGLLTGANTAPRTLAKLGRSMLVGHGHQKESSYHLDYPSGALRQGFVIGTMSRIDGVFPHYVTNPDWHQGFATVTRWPDGCFLVEHVVYQGGSLFWRDRRWRIEDYRGGTGA